MYPEWLPEELRERYDRIKDNNNKPLRYNKEEHFLLLYNPNYENLGNWNTAREKMKVGENYVLGRAHTSGETEGHITWRELTPQSEKDIDDALYGHIWFVMKKK